MRAYVHRLPAAAPDDTTALDAAVDRGAIDPAAIVAVLGKTEGNGCVNDFTRGLATRALKASLAPRLGCSLAELDSRIAFVMSGGTEGGLSPHWLVFEARREGRGGRDPRLAIGVGFTRPLLPEEIGRAAQVKATAEAVRHAMAQASIASPHDVHYVQAKCPLLTRSRIAAAEARGHAVATEDTYLSMGYSRGASALGIAVALDEVAAERILDGSVCHDSSLYSRRASCSAGIELMECQVMVLGNSRAWSGDLVIGHGVMDDALDLGAAWDALALTGVQRDWQLSPAQRANIAAVLAKAEPSRNGLIRGRRHVMLDDSDIHASRHARAMVGGVLAGMFGDTQLFVSGGAEHQGPDGGGPIAVIARNAGLAAA